MVFFLDFLKQKENTRRAIAGKRFDRNAPRSTLAFKMS